MFRFSLILCTKFDQNNIPNSNLIPSFTNFLKPLLSLIRNKVVWDKHYSFNRFTVRNNFFIIFQSVYTSHASFTFLSFQMPLYLYKKCYLFCKLLVNYCKTLTVCVTLFCQRPPLCICSQYFYFIICHTSMLFYTPYIRNYWRGFYFVSLCSR